jgi:hypothetical protein
MTIKPGEEPGRRRPGHHDVRNFIAPSGTPARSGVSTCGPWDQGGRRRSDDDLTMLRENSPPDAS